MPPKTLALLKQSSLVRILELQWLPVNSMVNMTQKDGLTFLVCDAFGKRSQGDRLSFLRGILSSSAAV
ncbi:hypothetical protein OIU79_008098 [Salix purpurea]|uniref:Uncharacterized protein n=1 Tax=Salix purpurea TaxID=77065 RepID=A0A9Q0THS8_SALPP|nr:hypothetical protein OIU79_008098 [Salix purpurea]